MIKAIEKETGKQVLAFEIDNINQFKKEHSEGAIVCPHCNQTVILKQSGGDWMFEHEVYNPDCPFTSDMKERGYDYR